MVKDEMPKEGAAYYWISSGTGVICRSYWNSRNQFCQFRWSVGDVFETWEEAHRALALHQHSIEDKRRALK